MKLNETATICAHCARRWRHHTPDQTDHCRPAPTGCTIHPDRTDRCGCRRRNGVITACALVASHSALVTERTSDGG